MIRQTIRPLIVSECNLRASVCLHLSQGLWRRWRILAGVNGPEEEEEHHPGQLVRGQRLGSRHEERADTLHGAPHPSGDEGCEL